ncbi:MAG: Wzz/FepE/Etk N-terminal domain-containing protein [Bacteroidales bacterium]|nr:Wzz/FepE/Etk N-terminal domain-containing protein [Bacteroidales bacterium]
MADKSSFSNDSVDLLVFLYKKRKPIILITLIGAIASIIVSLMMTPMYKSTVVMYAASSASVSKSLLTNSGRGNMMAFGDEEETEQLLQILQSNDIVNYIVEKYNLTEHYSIDTTSKFKKTSLYKTFNSNISFSKTKLQSIQIVVYDEDPEYASNIANDISLYADTVMNKIRKKRAWDALLIVEYEYNKLNKQIQEMSDSLSTLNKLGVLEYKEQVTAYSSGLSQGIATGKISKSGIKYLENKLKELEEFGHAYNEISNFIEFEQDRLSRLKGKWVEAGVEYAQNLSYTFIVDKAFPAEKKSKPVRWLIVVMSTIATFVFSILIVAFTDFFKKFKEKVNSSK